MARTFPVNADRADQAREQYERQLRQLILHDLVREFLSYLDYQEESERDRVFHPIQISSCRVMMTEPLSMVIDQLRKRVKT